MMSTGCDGTATTPATPATTAATGASPVAAQAAATDLLAWNLGEKLSLAALGNAQADRGAVMRLHNEAQQLAREIGVTLEPLPIRTDNLPKDMAAGMNYLLKTTGPAVTSAIESRYGRRPSLLFQTSLKSNFLPLLYDSAADNRESLAIVDSLAANATETKLPEELWSPLVKEVRAKAPTNQVNNSVRAMQSGVAAYLKKAAASSSEQRPDSPTDRRSGPPALARTGAPPTSSAPSTPRSAPPVAPRALKTGEHYLRHLPRLTTEVIGDPSHAVDRQFEVQKIAFQNGVYIHPPAANAVGRVAYDLGGNFQRLTGAAGISDHHFGKAWSPLTFRVLGDGKVLWTSQPIQIAGDWEAFSIDVTGVRKLTLEVACSGEHTGAHGAWLDPILVQAN